MRGAGIMLLIIVLAATAGAYVYSRVRPADIRALPVFNEAAQIKEVVNIKRVSIPGPKEIQVIEKEKIVEKIALPEWVKKDANQQIISTGTVEPDRNRGNVEAVATLNTQTGESTMFMRQKDRKWLGLPNEAEIGIGYGIDSKGQVGATVYARYDIARIGGVVIHAYAEGSTDRARAEVRVGYRF